MPLTELILTENVPGLGAEADVVKVRRGYARNYLLPRGKAYEVTPAALRQLDALKQKRAEREARELNEAEELSRRIEKLRVIFTLATGETGKAFGSITAQDIVNRLKDEVGVEIDRHKIMLERPIKDTGDHEVQIKVHHDVTAQLKFNVKSAAEEAKRAEEAVTAEPEKKRRSFFQRKKRKKKQNKWRLNRPLGQERSLVKREMALAEVRQREAAKKLSPFRRQVLRKIFTAPRPIVSMPSKACLGRCCSHHEKPSRNASKKLTKNTFTFPRTGRSTTSSSISGTRGRQST